MSPAIRQGGVYAEQQHNKQVEHMWLHQTDSCFAHFTVTAKTTDGKGSLVKELGKLAQAERWELAELADRPLTLEEVFLALTETE